MKTQFTFLVLTVFTIVTAFCQDSITKPDLTSSSKVMGLQFTEPELDSMIGNIRFSRVNIQNMRKMPLDNRSPMTLAHSPVLPGMTFDKVQQPVKWNIPANINVPKNKNDLAFFSILQLASLIKN